MAVNHGETTEQIQNVLGKGYISHRKVFSMSIQSVAAHLFCMEVITGTLLQNILWEEHCVCGPNTGDLFCVHGSDWDKGSRQVDHK